MPAAPRPRSWCVLFPRDCLVGAWVASLPGRLESRGFRLPRAIVLAGRAAATPSLLGRLVLTLRDCLVNGQRSCRSQAAQPAGFDFQGSPSWRAVGPPPQAVWLAGFGHQRSLFCLGGGHQNTVGRVGGNDTFDWSTAIGRGLC